MLNIWRARRAGLSLLFALCWHPGGDRCCCEKMTSMNRRRTAAPVGDAWYVNDLTQAGFAASVRQMASFPGPLCRCDRAGSQSKISPVFRSGQRLLLSSVGEAEFSIAVDPGGLKIVGFNDTPRASPDAQPLVGRHHLERWRCHLDRSGTVTALTATTGAVFGDPDVKVRPGRRWLPVHLLVNLREPVRPADNVDSPQYRLRR